jgi:hypothetical protein
MPDILIRDLSQHTLLRLKTRAKLHGRSLESEIKLLLEQAAPASMEEILEICRRWRQRFAGRKFSDSADLIREDRDR